MFCSENPLALACLCDLLCLLFYFFSAKSSEEVKTQYSHNTNVKTHIKLCIRFKANE